MAKKLRRGLAATLSVVALSATAAPALALPDWRTTPTQWSNPRAHTPKVVDLRFARHGTFDRVVIDVSGRRPGYRTMFAKRLYYDPSGKPIPLAGRYKMYVVLRPAYTYSPTSGKNLYHGPRLVRPGLPSLKGIALAGSFEGVTTFGFTSSHKSYRIYTLTDPSRVVIDWKH
jgi:hypothetical protein